MRFWLIVFIILMLVIAGVWYAVVKTGRSDSGDSGCTSLGCDSNARYAGSVNSDKYYECSCRYAKQIKEENVLCFESDQEAIEKGYQKVEC